MACNQFLISPNCVRGLRQNYKNSTQDLKIFFEKCSVLKLTRFVSGIFVQKPRKICC